MEAVEHVCLNTWRKRVTMAIKRGHFTGHEIMCSDTWNLCAVGEAFRRVPKKVKSKIGHWESDYDYAVKASRMPTKDVLLISDRRLEDLGCEFVSAVHGNEFKGALKIINRIEKRLDAIIRKANV